MKYQPRGYNYRPKAAVTIVAIPYFATSNIRLSNALRKKRVVLNVLFYHQGVVVFKNTSKDQNINQHFNVLRHSCDTEHHPFGK
jgi:sulfur relay (sulfurtransferase) complex TusBCD TusD component (DsrE family)